jgi:Na+/H+ antiporter NhaD/arsenite permease-like protein
VDVDPSLILALAIVAVTYLLIALDLMHRTLAALIGALLIVNFGIVPSDVALSKVNMDTLLLLLGMMIIMSVVEKVGFFEWLTMRIIALSRHRLRRLLIILVVATAVLSAFLDNVTTVLLMAPVVLEVTSLMDLNPLPFLIPMAFASNIGGTATLIGDPPNIMIGTAAELSFMDFVWNLAPVVALIVVVLLGYTWLVFGREVPDIRIGQECVTECERRFRRRDTRSLAPCAVIFAATLAAFVVHERIDVPSYVIAVSGGTALLFLTGLRPEDVMRDIEWSSLVFFASIFVVVGALEHLGVSLAAARALLGATGQDKGVLMPVLLWLSALLSALLGAIPVTAAMIPVVGSIAALGVTAEWPWWALSLGTCLAGNATLVSAAANIVVAGLAEREGYPISFRQFARYGVPLTVASLAVSTLYLWALY